MIQAGNPVLLAAHLSIVLYGEQHGLTRDQAIALAEATIRPTDKVAENVADLLAVIDETLAAMVEA